MEYFYFFFASLPFILPSYDTSEVIRVSTRHYEPFLLKNYNGNFTEGIEFQLIRTIAKRLDMNLEFQEFGTEFDRNNFK